uniref:Uncharacterized protein n=1 Tax=viral metagenome TaxID=1070528 RepID=A0A6M3JEA0_9ZZZZ
MTKVKCSSCKSWKDIKNFKITSTVCQDCKKQKRLRDFKDKEAL